MERQMIECILDKLFQFRVIINCQKDPYLKRWYVIRTEPFGLFIHKFIRSDEDRALHDHPWNFIIIPIWRGYIEHSQKKFVTVWRHEAEHMAQIKRRVWPLMISIRPAEYQHRVELIEGKPAWSIFLRFKKRREWGFWPSGIFYNWKQWWNDLCED
jgi:hypothetical protein